MAPVPENIVTLVEKYIHENAVMMFSKSYCPFCKKVRIFYNNQFPNRIAVLQITNRLEDILGPLIAGLKACCLYYSFQ